MMYLGTLGRMVAIKCPSAQRVTPAGRYSFNTTLGGAVKAQAGPDSRRAWDVSSGSLTTPADVGAIMDFASGAWGAGPFWFVPTDAPVVNLLPPAAASCDPATIGLSEGAELVGSPPMSLDGDGFAARSVFKNNTGTAVFGNPVPVISGMPVTGSAWVIGQGRLRLVFVDSNGVTISYADSTPAAWSSPHRLTVTARTPRTASAVKLAISGAIIQAARPAITWTDTAYEWGDGQGCHKSIVHSVSRDLVKAWDNPRTGRWSDVSFTIQEVG